MNKKNGSKLVLASRNEVFLFSLCRLQISLVYKTYFDTFNVTGAIQVEQRSLSKKGMAATYKYKIMLRPF